MSLIIENNGTEQEVEQTKEVNNLYQFTNNYPTTGSYTIKEIHYEKEDVTYKLVLSDYDMNAKFGVNQDYDGYDENDGLYVDLDGSTSDDVSSENVDFAVAEISGNSESEAIEEITDAIENSEENVNPTTLMSTLKDTFITDAYAAEKMTICLDPGHGGADSGAINSTYGVYERDLNYKIATYLKSYLEEYNVNVIMTHSIDENPSLYDRCKYAYDNGASVVISIHLNASGGAGTGAEVYYPNTNYRADLSSEGQSLAQEIENQLCALGITNRGIKILTIDSSYDDYTSYEYADGSYGDYYGIIRNSKALGLTGIIVEHCFIDNNSDYLNYLSTDAKLQQLAQADCAGIVAAYNLNEATIATHGVSYTTHVQDYGWQNNKYDGDLSGTTGESKRLEGIKIQLGESTGYSGSIQYKTHIQNIGWESDWTSDGNMSGTTGQSLRLEAIQIQLTGDIANYYDVYYCVHAENFGWLDWAKNGQKAGTSGYSYRLEAIKIVLVEKGGSAPGATTTPYIGANEEETVNYIQYQTHVQDDGWQNDKYDGEEAGTTGRSLRLEGIRISKASGLSDFSGSIQYRTHIQNIGWESGWTSDGNMSGTEGQSLRLEAIQIKLTGDLAEKYDVYYCVHAQNFGWLDWAKNGESAGTAGYSYRLEAIKIVLVEKGGSAPGSTTQSFIGEDTGQIDNSDTSETSDYYSIMGNSNVTVAQMVAYFNKNGGTYDVFSKYGTAYDGVLAKGGASTIEEFCQMYYDEAKAEGVNVEVAFAQAMLETGFLQFGGDVYPDQYNFAGLGATGGVKGNEFTDVRTGIRAQIQHLKCYASTEPLNNTCVDKRWSDSLRGMAIYVEYLSIPNNPYGKGWASSSTYSDNLLTMIQNLKNC